VRRPTTEPRAESASWWGHQRDTAAPAGDAVDVPASTGGRDGVQEVGDCEGVAGLCHTSTDYPARLERVHQA